MRQSTVGSEAVGVIDEGTGGSGGVFGGGSDGLTIDEVYRSPADRVTPAPRVPGTIPDVSTPSSGSPDASPTPLGCGCLVRTGRDFLGRVVGTVVEHGAS